MVLLSKYPIDKNRARDVPEVLVARNARSTVAGRPEGRRRLRSWYSQQELGVFRLSLEEPLGRADPVIDGGLPCMCSRRTRRRRYSTIRPPFPAGVDFNGRRNHDEIRFWADYM